jgi:hypothetical protein
VADNAASARRVERAAPVSMGDDAVSAMTVEGAAYVSMGGNAASASNVEGTRLLAGSARLWMGLIEIGLRSRSVASPSTSMPDTMPTLLSLRELENVVARFDHPQVSKMGISSTQIFMINEKQLQYGPQYGCIPVAPPDQLSTIRAT